MDTNLSDEAVEAALLWAEDKEITRSQMELLAPEPYDNMTDGSARILAAEVRRLRAEREPSKAAWIPCKARLPKDGERVLAMYEGVYARREVTVWHDGGGNVHFGHPSEPDGKGSQPATHWMPLPGLRAQG